MASLSFGSYRYVYRRPENLPLIIKELQKRPFFVKVIEFIFQCPFDFAFSTIVNCDSVTLDFQDELNLQKMCLKTGSFKISDGQTIDIFQDDCCLEIGLGGAENSTEVFLTMVRGLNAYCILYEGLKPTVISFSLASQFIFKNHLDDLYVPIYHILRKWNYPFEELLEECDLNNNLEAKAVFIRLYHEREGHQVEELRL